MRAAQKQIHASFRHDLNWKSVNWKKVGKKVKELQMRIAKAVREGKFRLAKSLQWILTHSFYAKLLAIKRVVTNKGKATPGIDGVVWNTPRKKMQAVNLLNRKGYSNVLGIDSIEKKIEPALKRNLNCKVARAFEFLHENEASHDVIFCEQEINHLTKNEILTLMDLCRKSLKSGGILIIHSLNGANPIVGAENLALNFDHYNSFR